MTRTNTCQGSRRRFLRAIGAGAAASGAAGLAGCVTDVGGNGDDEGGGEFDTVRVGALEPLSGSYADLGEEHLQGVELGVDFVNGNDEFDFEFEIEDYDTQAETGDAQLVASEAVEDFEAGFLLGCISSSVALAINEFALENEVIYFPGAADTRITGESCNEWVFRFETHTAQIAEVMTAWMVEELGDRIFYHVADYPYGHSVQEEVETRMESLSDSYEEVGTTASEFGSTDFEAFISQIGDAADDADALVVGMTGGDLVVFLQQASRQGLMDEIPVVTTTASFTPVRQGAGEAAYGVYSGVRYVPDVDTGDNQEFVSDYEDAYGEAPDNFSRVGFESIRMLARGIREADSDDPAAVRDALPGLEMETIFGTNVLRECDHQSNNPVWMGELHEPDDGELAEVELIAELDGDEAIPPCEDVPCEL